MVGYYYVLSKKYKEIFMIKKIVFLITVVTLLTSCSEPIQLAPDAILPDGGVYQGEMKNDLFHGKGTLKYSDGTYYEGLFKQGLYHGQGKQVFFDGSSYEGKFFEGKVTGTFLMQVPNENLHYKGELLNGSMHGEGTLTTDDYVYVGDFKDRQFNGQGKITYSNGTVYEGEFKNNFYHGFGRLSYENGAKYEGEFQEGNYEGQGLYTIGSAWYEGIYENNKLNGQGEYLDSEGNHYIGEVAAWQAHGEGELIKADGTRLKGIFEHGYLEGVGEATTPSGDYYEGDFKYGKYDGIGTLSVADESVYHGEFSYGVFHGDGKLTTTDIETDEVHVLEGIWRQGRLTFNVTTGERQHVEAELALEKHQEILSDSLEGILKSSDDKTNFYFLGVAGDGSQSVFRRELEFVSSLVEQKYLTKGRSVLLINHHNSAEIYPMATRRSIASAITSIGEKMNNSDDVLFLYLSSHGAKNHDFYLNHDSIELPDISPNELKKLLVDAQVKWKVIMVSACYSGGFISELQDDYTLLMTASDSKSTSFGCSEESEMTYFAKALFKEVISNNPDIKLSDAFVQAKEIIIEWETEQEIEASNPMISAPNAIVEKIAEL